MDSSKRRPSTAIVTVATGARYLERYGRMFRPSVERYARRIGVDFVVIDRQIRPSPYKAWWQKLLVWSYPPTSGYERVMLLDADIYVTKHARDAFAALGDKPWGIVHGNPYDLERFRETDKLYFQSCPPEGRPPFAGNVGMIIATRGLKGAFERIYDDYCGKEARDMETGPIFYYLWHDGTGDMMPTEFNVPVAMHVMRHGCSLRSVLKMYDEGSFLHFVGNKWLSIRIFVAWFDTTESRAAKAIVRFFGRPGWDWLTAPAFKAFQWSVGVYGYRIKPLFSR